ncbi:MAG: DNA polymerase II [Chitinivibrionales bacterium]|nr:DNA polymerase II [Chitinivibrionales bacterium]
MNQSYFLLTADGRDTAAGYVIDIIAAGQDGSWAHFSMTTFKPMFFVDRNADPKHTVAAFQRKSLQLNSMDGLFVDCLYFTHYATLLACAENLHSLGIQTFESDVHPVDRFLMERMIKGGFLVSDVQQIIQHDNYCTYVNPQIRGTDVRPNLSLMSVDIETNGLTDDLYCIGCSGQRDVVLMIGSGDDEDAGYLRYVSDEKTLLQHFFTWVHADDPDIICGWNVIAFDLSLIQKRCERNHVRFDIGRPAGCRHQFNLPSKDQRSSASLKVSGRVILDIPILLKANNHHFESFSLNAVSRELLGKSKLIEQSGIDKIKEINDLFIHDKKNLAAYNLNDCHLVKQIVEKTSIIATVVERAKLNGQFLDRPGGSVAAFDFLYLPQLHRKGYVSRDKKEVGQASGAMPGGFVMEPKPGIFDNVLLFDFMSLYPTLIMTFFIDPLGFTVNTSPRCTAPSGHSFSRTESILPEIIAALMRQRRTAKQNKDNSLSYAIKILMNSFYGVLGSPGCRFFLPEVARAITTSGHYIFKQTRAYIEQSSGFSVIYGDTDSLFVLLGPDMQTEARAVGNRIVADVNSWIADHIRAKFDTESALELKFEEHFRHFLMPSIRGTTAGSKKRYCGTIEESGDLRLVFKGMESVRSDWTDLAKEFQYTLYKKVFLHEPVDQIEHYILTTVGRLRSGGYDRSLVYARHLRKAVHEYTAVVPPHVQAARLLKNPPSVIRYFMTKQGPQPVEQVNAALDYDHYISTQLKPVADSILEWINRDFDSIISGQLDLFGP